MATDEQLIRQIRQGKSEAFGQLFRKYREHIYSVCLSILKNPQDAEEVAADTFVLAYLKLEQLKNPEKFFAWLKKIAQNRSRDFLRSRREETIPFATALKHGASFAIEGTSRQSAPDESLLKQELMDAVMEAIELLPQKDREVIRAHIDGLSHAEISEKLGISYQASRSRLYRARKKIAEYTKDLLNAIFGKLLMLPFEKIVSGGILAMKIGTSTKVTVGITCALVAVFIGVFATHHSPDDKQHEAIIQQEQVSPIKQERRLVHSTKRRSDKLPLQKTEVSPKSKQGAEAAEATNVSHPEIPPKEEIEGEEESAQKATEEKETLLESYLRITRSPEYLAEAEKEIATTYQTAVPKEETQAQAKSSYANIEKFVEKLVEGLTEEELEAILAWMEAEEATSGGGEIEETDFLKGELFEEDLSGSESGFQIEEIESVSSPSEEERVSNEVNEQSVEVSPEEGHGMFQQIRTKDGRIIQFRPIKGQEMRTFSINSEDEILIIPSP